MEIFLVYKGIEESSAVDLVTTDVHQMRSKARRDKRIEVWESGKLLNAYWGKVGIENLMSRYPDTENNDS